MTLPSFHLPMNVVSRKRLAFLCAVILTVFFTLLFSWAGRNGLFAIPDSKKQTFTELYFTDTEAIPLQVTSGQAYSVPFAIVSREADRWTYRYRIQVSEGTKTSSSEIQTVELAPGERAIRRAPFTVHDASQPLKLTVELIDKQQTITFRIPQ